MSSVLPPPEPSIIQTLFPSRTRSLETEGATSLRSEMNGGLDKGIGVTAGVGAAVGKGGTVGIGSGAKTVGCSIEAPGTPACTDRELSDSTGLGRGESGASAAAEPVCVVAVGTAPCAR